MTAQHALAGAPEHLHVTAGATLTHRVGVNLTRLGEFVKFTADETAPTLCQALREAFEYVGGVPAEVLLDNAMGVVIERDTHGAWPPGQLPDRSGTR